jgi:hypothetical protein
VPLITHAAHSSSAQLLANLEVMDASFLGLLLCNG